MQKGFATLVLILVGVLIVVLGVGFWAYQNNFLNFRKISSFGDCAKFYPVLESYPAQCNTPDGQHFVQPLSEKGNIEGKECNAGGIGDSVNYKCPKGYVCQRDYPDLNSSGKCIRYP